MMLTTLVWAASVRGELVRMSAALETLPDLMSLTIEHTIQMADRMAETISGSRPIYLLARGASQGATLCGRLVLEEVARQPAVALEAAEFRQGPNEVVDEHFGAILLLGNGKTVPLNRSLGLEIQRHGGKVITVGVEDDIKNLPGMTFSLPGMAEPFMPILEVVPIQGLAYKLAESRGFTPGLVRYITKIIREEAADQT
jgi:glucosamine--fructose-6-phosphate aminotransferase (isomerizing)